MNSKFKIGDVVTAIKGTDHYARYGAFIAEVVEIGSKYYGFKVIDEGLGNDPISLSFPRPFTTTEIPAENEFELAKIVGSPLWQALK